MTIKEIKDRIYKDYIASFKNAITPLRVSFFDKFSDSLAGTFQLLYIYFNNILKDSFLTTCTQSRVLSYFAPLKGLTQKNATVATGIVRFTGTDASIIPLGTILIYNNLEYKTTELGTIASGYADVQCESVEAGSENNTLENITLNLSVPVDGIDNSCISIGGFSGANDRETIENLRNRTKEKFANPESIDNYYTYTSLAETLPNIKKAFVSENKNGAGTFGITALTVGNNGVPIQADIDAIENLFISQNAIPVYVIPEYFLPTIITQDYTILLQDTSDENKTYITQLIRDYQYIYQRPNSSFYFSGLAAFLETKGARMTSPDPLTFQAIANDEILDLGTITWV